MSKIKFFKDKIDEIESLIGEECREVLTEMLADISLEIIETTPELSIGDIAKLKKLSKKLNRLSRNIKKLPETKSDNF